jgi:hypothetical protein
MDQERFVNSYVELLNATLTEALQKNIVLQAQHNIMKQDIQSFEQKIREDELKIKEIIAQRDGEILSLKSQLNDERRQSASVANEREEVKKSVQHVDTFKNELLKARKEIVEKDRIISKLIKDNSKDQPVKSLKKKTTSSETTEINETIKDAGNF